MRMKIHHPSASLGAGSGTEITEKTLWKPKLRVLRVSVVNDFRRSTYQSRFPSSVILSAGRRGDRSRRTPIAAGSQNVAARQSNNLAITCGHRGPSTARNDTPNHLRLTSSFAFPVSSYVPRQKPRDRPSGLPPFRQERAKMVGHLWTWSQGSFQLR